METNSVIGKIQTANDSPLEFDQLINAWNSLCERAWIENSNDFQFADIENAALAALAGYSDQTPPGPVGNEISRMLSSFDYPTYLVTDDGHIAASNTSASIEFDLNNGDSIDSLPFTIDGSQVISDLIIEKMSEEKEFQSDATLKRAISSAEEKDATIAITASFGRVPMTLVFVVTTKWKPKSTVLLRQQFGLTEAESEILVSFVDGYSAHGIARQRNRSYATIRTQFQSILNKTGTRNQTELLRTVLSISDFSRSIGEIIDTANHPYRRCAEILQEGGRIVEVTLMGDTTGKPVLTIANAANYTFNATIEQALHDAGLFIISLCAPGCGRTDSVPESTNRMDCIAKDAAAVLDQLNIDRCTMLAYNANSPVCYELASRIEDRFNHFIQIAAVPPNRFVHSSATTQSSWVNGILKARMAHPGMKNMLFKGAMKAWTAIGAKQFMRLQMSSNPVDCKTVLATENIVEYEHALKTATRGGVSAAAEDLALTFEDWTTKVKSLNTNITVVHGTRDKLVTIDMVRRFADAFPDKIRMIEIPNAGMPLLQSHTDEVVKLLKSAAETRGPGATLHPIKNPVFTQPPFLKVNPG